MSAVLFSLKTWFIDAANKCKTFFAKVGKNVKTTTEKVAKLRFSPLILILIFLIVSYLAYLAFAIWQPFYEGEIFKTVTTGTDAEEINKLFVMGILSGVVASWNLLPIQLFMVSCLVILLLIAIIWFAYKKLTWKRITILVLIAGAIMRLGYGLYTDALLTRQHDMWSYLQYDFGTNSYAYTGHFGITMNIFKYNAWPFPVQDSTGAWRLDWSYQYYHPKFAHTCMAYFMKFNQLLFGTENQWILYQSIRILTITISLTTLYICYRIIKELNLNERATFIMAVFVAFCPIFYRLTAMTNNDPFVMLFMFMTIYFTIRWYKTRRYSDIVFIAISIGLAMASKLSGALIAIFTAIIFIIKLVKVIKEKDHPWLLVLQFVIFALVVFPIGLFFPIFAYVKYQQPFLYIWTSLNDGLRIPDSAINNPFLRFFVFDVIQYFHSCFMILWSYGKYSQDTNAWEAMLKSSLFGEFSYGEPTYLMAGLILFVAFVIALFFTASFIFNTTKRIKEKNYKFNFPLVVMIILFFLFAINYIYLNWSTPYTCSLDFRYIVPIVIPFAWMLAKGFDRFDSVNLSKPKTYKVTTSIFYAALGLFAISSCLFYVLVPTR